MPQFGQCPLGGSLRICITARFFGKSAAHILPLQAVARLAAARWFCGHTNAISRAQSLWIGREG